MIALKVDNLYKKYKDVTALNGVSLSVEEGEIFGLLGENGAGKSTLIKCICGLNSVGSGSFSVFGYDGVKDGNKIKSLLGLSPQETAVSKNLTVKENLLLFCGLYGIEKKEAEARAEEIITSLKLENVKNKVVKKLSGGTARRVCIGTALISKPKLLFLDEPTVGLDVRARRELWKTVKELKKTTTVLLTTHYLEEAEALCDRLAVLSRGKVRAVGTVEEIKEASGKDNLEDAFILLTEETL